MFVPMFFEMAGQPPSAFKGKRICCKTSESDSIEHSWRCPTFLEAGRRYLHLDLSSRSFRDFLLCDPCLQEPQLTRHARVACQLPEYNQAFVSGPGAVASTRRRRLAAARTRRIRPGWPHASSWWERDRGRPGQISSAPVSRERPLIALTWSRAVFPHTCTFRGAGAGFG